MKVDYTLFAMSTEYMQTEYRGHVTACSLLIGLQDRELLLARYTRCLSSSQQKQCNIWHIGHCGVIITL
jgi:hypothetical protein